MGKGETETVVVIPDIQAPQQDNKAIAVAIQLIKYIRPSKVVFLGDVVAADSVSKYDKTTWKEAELKLTDEIDAANDVLDRFDAAFKSIKVREIYYLEGNHERRILVWAIKNAMALGSRFDGLRLENLLQFKKRGYTYIVEESQPLKLGKANFVHGLYLNQYHAAKTVRDTGRNTFYGHTHDYQVYTSMHFEDEEPRMAMSCGCLCRYNQDFMKGKPNNWMKGIAIINFEKSGGFTPLYIPIINSMAIYDGKIFGG